VDQEQPMASSSAAHFARGVETVELRGECPRHIVDVLDAVAVARDKTRIQIANEVLGAWAEKVLHEATLVHRVVQRNPPRVDTPGGGDGHGR
jgi:hypothetical protein